MKVKNESMEEKRILNWIFNAPDDVVTIEKFEAWEKQQQSEWTEERSQRIYDQIMEK